MRLTFIQTGDFREAAERIAESGEETYHAQRHSMSVVWDAAREAENVTVICISANAPYRIRLEGEVDAVGLRFYGPDGRNIAALRQALDAARPSHVVVRFPDAGVIADCLDRGAQVLPSFADSFAARPGLRRLPDLWRFRRLARLLNDRRISHVGNHNIAASESLARIGVRPGKIVPWDWPRPHRPEDFAPKAAPGTGPLKLLSVGAVSEAKGVGDAIRALALLPPETARLTIVGAGMTDAMRALARETGVADRVEFRGRIPFEEVVPVMRAHDALVVFTRTDYAEGLPGVIYQGLAARLPILASPHPVFRHYFEDGRDVAFARSSTPAALAERIGALGRDPALYAALSEGAAAAFGRIVLDTDWVEFVRRWLSHGSEDLAWLDARTLARLRSGGGG